MSDTTQIYGTLGPLELLAKRLDAVEDDVRKVRDQLRELTPLAEEHDDRLDGHDVQLEGLTRIVTSIQSALIRVEANVDRLADSQTASNMAMLGMLRRMCAKLGLEP